MSNKSRAELYRLKMKMEIIRTVCPVIMIIIQLLIVIEIFQENNMTYEMVLSEIRKGKRATKIAKAWRKRKKARAARDWYQARIMPTFVPRGTYLKIWKICFFQIFGAGAPVVSQRLFLHGPRKCVTKLLAIGRVFYLTRSARVRQQQYDDDLFGRRLRRLQYSTDAMSSLFCDWQQLNAVWSSLAQSAKISADCTKSTSTLSSTF